MRFRARFLVFGFALLLALAILGQPVSRGQSSLKALEPKLFEPAEELVYEAEFSRALLRKVDVADFRFTATRKPLDNAPFDKMSPTYSLILTGDVTSKGFFPRLFNLRFRQQVESTVEPESFTVQRTSRVDEQGKRVRESEAIFDKASGKVVWTERDPNDPSRKPRTEISDFSGQVQDILSAIYFVRTLPLEVGKTFEISISDSGQVYTLPLRVVEKKRMKTALGRIQTVRVDPEIFGPDRMIAHKGHFSVWLTTDRRRIPVKARLKSDYGTFDIKLKKAVQNSDLVEYLTKQN
jgi:hypothetical protein